MKIQYKELSLWEKLYLPAIFKGLSLTWKHLLMRPKFTMEYPEEKPELGPRSRGFPKLVKDKEGHPKCVACGLCAAVCPPHAITLQAEESEDFSWERTPVSFEIDMGRCILCGMCEEACPVDAIVLSDTYELVINNTQKWVFEIDKLLEDWEGKDTELFVKNRK